MVKIIIIRNCLNKSVCALFIMSLRLNMKCEVFWWILWMFNKEFLIIYGDLRYVDKLRDYVGILGIIDVFFLII